MNRSLYSKLAKVCRKESPADCIFKNASIFDAYTATFYPGDVAIKQGHIAGIGRDFLGTNVIDCKGKSLVPAFIDAHCHPEATMVSPHSLLSTAVLYGTTTFIVNPKEAVMVSGKAGLDYLPMYSLCSPFSPFAHPRKSRKPALTAGTFSPIFGIPASSDWKKSWIQKA